MPKRSKRHVLWHLTCGRAEIPRAEQKKSFTAGGMQMWIRSKGSRADCKATIGSSILIGFHSRKERQIL